MTYFQIFKKLKYIRKTNYLLSIVISWLSAIVKKSNGDKYFLMTFNFQTGLHMTNTYSEARRDYKRFACLDLLKGV